MCDARRAIGVQLRGLLGVVAACPGPIAGVVRFTVPPFLLQQFVFYKYLIISIVLIATMVFRPEGLLGTVSIRPRKNLGGTLELLTAETAVEASELPAVTDTEGADLEGTAGAIVED